MTKAKTNTTRKWLLAASLILAAGAAQAQSYVLIAVPTYEAYGAVQPMTGEGIPLAPIVAVTASGTACSNQFSALQTEATALQNAANSHDGFTYPATVLGGCFAIGPTAGTNANASLSLGIFSGTGGTGFLLNLPTVPVYSVAVCNGALSAITSSLGLLWTQANSTVNTCL
jgi:hypothetical protein